MNEILKVPFEGLEIGVSIIRILFSPTDEVGTAQSVKKGVY